MRHNTMKCSKCGAVAVINMRHHRLALCEDCYLEWVPQRVQHTIQRFGMFQGNERVLVAVSGGKDSLALWDILTRLGHETVGLYVDLGIAEADYSHASLQKIEQFARRNGGMPYQVVDVKAGHGCSVPEIAQLRRRTGKTCSICGLVKRHEMNRLAHEGGFAAIATGHNLDDEAAVLMQNTLHWQTGYLGRQAPGLHSSSPRLARKVKPLCLFYEREVAAYTLVRGIDYIYDECPHSIGAKTLYYKELLNRLEDRSLGAKQHFYFTFLKAKSEGLMQFAEPETIELSDCRICGQPTSAAGMCAFCRMWEDPIIKERGETSGRQHGNPVGA